MQRREINVMTGVEIVIQLSQKEIDDALLRQVEEESRFKSLDEQVTIVSLIEALKTAGVITEEQLKTKTIKTNTKKV